MKMCDMIIRAIDQAMMRFIYQEHDKIVIFPGWPCQNAIYRQWCDEQQHL